MIAGKMRIICLLLLVAFSVPGLAQKQKTKAQLQKEKQQNLEKIKEVEKILSETSSQKKNTLGELSAVKQRITMQENLISSIKSEISYLDNDIDENNEFIRALQEDLKKLKKEYASMLYAAQKANNSATRLTFLFSAESFQQLVMRMQYMKQYAEKRKQQAAAIIAVQEELSGQVKIIESKRNEKNTLLTEEVKENNNLTSLKKKQNDLVKNLEKQEKSLKQDIENIKKSLAVLDKKINEIIKEEIARAAAEAKANAKSKTNTNYIALSASFEDNRSKFSWPAQGFVSLGFGRQSYPGLKGVVVENDGINIQTQQNEKVKTIFNGEVKMIAFLPNIGNTVIIAHGEYFTVYSGLKDVYVKRGQKVNTGQELGQLQVNSEGVSELRFQIRKNTTPLNPQLWLRN
jgi:septal ring factor EnvC (AmiA/AmiB activator)